MKKIKLKDKEYTEAIIKISKIKEHYKNGNYHTYKDKLVCVKIVKPMFNTMSCFTDNVKGKKDLFKFIKDELGIK